MRTLFGLQTALGSNRWVFFVARWKQSRCTPSTFCCCLALLRRTEGCSNNKKETFLLFFAQRSPVWRGKEKSLCTMQMGGRWDFSIHKCLDAIMFLRLFGRRSNAAFLLQPPVWKRWIHRLSSSCGAASCFHICSFQQCACRGSEIVSLPRMCLSEKQSCFKKYPINTSFLHKSCSHCLFDALEDKKKKKSRLQERFFELHVCLAWFAHGTYTVYTVRSCTFALSIFATWRASQSLEGRLVCRARRPGASLGLRWRN